MQDLCFNCIEQVSTFEMYFLFYILEYKNLYFKMYNPEYKKIS